MFDSGNHMLIFSDIMTLLVSIYRDCVLLISPSTTQKFPPLPGSPCYKTVPLGHDTLARKLINELATLSSDNKSNHS